MQRIMMMSGFLGAGKTTSMVALAQKLQDAGVSACLITNDLGENLVDTAYVRSFDIPVLEIPNTCCCQDVDTLNDAIVRHIDAYSPDIVVFEPVGCCVDMVKLVYGNLMDAYPGAYELAPISAIVDPHRYQAIYMGLRESTFPEYIAYMFRKQIEEADLVIVNKIDLLAPDELEAICADMRARFPEKTVLAISAFEHTGIDAWMRLALEGATALARTDVDMDYIMEGCEKLGWYNKVCQVESNEAVDYAAFCERFVRDVRDRFVSAEAEIAHLKIAASQGETVCKTALTSCANEPATYGALACAGEAVLNVNIRALMDADALNATMEAALADALEAFGLVVTAQMSQTFLSSDCAPAAAAEYVPGTKGTRCCVPGYNDGDDSCCCCDEEKGFDMAEKKEPCCCGGEQKKEEAKEEPCCCGGEDKAEEEPCCCGDDTKESCCSDSKYSNEDDPYKGHKKTVIVDHLFLDLSVCDRCQGTDERVALAVERCRPVLAACGFNLVLNQIEIEDEELAERYRFYSSPTVRVNGVDVCPSVEENDCDCCREISDYDVKCRVFPFNGTYYEKPPTDMLVANIVNTVIKGIKPERDDSPYVLPENLAGFFEGKRKKAATKAAGAEPGEATKSCCCC